MNKRNDGEGTYTQRADGSWQCKIQKDKQRVSGSGRTREEALSRARTLAAAVGDRRTKQTVAELVTEWSALTSPSIGLKPTTHDQYRSLLRSRVVPIIGTTKVERLSKRAVSDLFPVGSTSPAATLRSTYAALVKVLDYGVDRGLVAVNVAREVRRPPAPERQPRHIDSDAVAEMLTAAAGDRLELAAWLSFGCGLRRGEILALRWADIELDAGLVSVSGNVTRSSAGLVRGTPKTKRGKRIVPAPPIVVEQLRAHKRRQATEQLAAGSSWHPLGMVLTNEIGGVVEPRLLSRRWQVWAKAAKVADTGTHIGRHYAASTLLASGAASVADVAAQMGHDPAVLLNTYAVAVAAGQRAASDVLGASLTPRVRETSAETSGLNRGGS